MIDVAAFQRRQHSFSGGHHTAPDAMGFGEWEANSAEPIEKKMFPFTLTWGIEGQFPFIPRGCQSISWR